MTFLAGLGNHALPPTLLRAGIALILTILVSTGLHAQSHVENGVPISEHEFSFSYSEADGMQELNTKAGYYPGVFLVSDGLNLDTLPTQWCLIPGAWTNPKYVSQVQPRDGYGSIRLSIEILNSKSSDELALLLPIIHSAWRLYVDGGLIASGGTPGASADQAQGGYGPRVVTLPSAKNDQYDLIFEVSNYEDSSPWVRENLAIGSKQAIDVHIRKWMILNGLLAITLLYTAISMLLGYALKPIFFSQLMLGSFALVLAIRHTTVGYSLMTALFQAMPYGLDSRIAHVCFYWATTFGYMYISRTFYKEPWPWMAHICIALAGAYSIFTIAAQKFAYQTILPGYQIFTLFIVLYVCIRLVQARIDGSSTSGYMMAGMILLSVAITNDIIFTLVPGKGLELSAPALLIIVFTQSIYIQWTITKGYEQSSIASQRLSRLLDRQEGIQAELETQVKLRTSELSDALLQARNASQAKSNFLANISHEVRTPLNGILGFSELLMQRNGDPALNNYIELIHVESQRLLEIINLILDFSKAEAGKLTIEPHVFDLPEMLQSVNVTARMLSGKHNIHYLFHFDETLPRYIAGDSLRIRQIIDNLISNAFKFTEVGHVRFSVRSAEKSSVQIWLIIEVEDTGIGIAADKQASIFESFEQADSSTSRRYGGTGLGTAIVKSLTQTMGGEVRLTSEVGKGSVFSVRLPLGIVDDVNRDQYEFNRKNRNANTIPRWRNHPTALVVEDYPVNLELVKRILEDSGWNVRAARDGIEAVDMLRTRNFDLVLMDIQMPGLDGLEVTAKAREQFQYQGIILGLSANAYESDRQSCLQAGMQDLIPKPIRRQNMLNNIASYIPAGEYVDLQTQTYRPPAFTDKEPVNGPTQLLEELNGDLLNFTAMLKEFLQSVPEQVTMAERHLAGGSLDELHRVAHSIKGGALNFGGNDLAELSLRVEQAAREGRIESLPTLLKDLRAYTDQLRQL